MIRFDTRDTKPKLYNVAILSAMFVAAAIVLFLIKPPVPAALISAVTTVYVGIVIVLLVRAFIGQIRYNPYSYNTIYYMGFSLYLLAVFIILMITSIRLAVESPDLSTSLAEESAAWIISTLFDSPRVFMLLSLPFILVFSVALIISNVSLIRHEGKRFVNFLGILLAILMLGGEGLLFFAHFHLSGPIKEVFLYDVFLSIFSSLYLYYECMIIGVIVADVMTARYEPEKDKDYIIILGCSMRKDGSLTPLLKGRTDRALGFYRAQLEKTGKAPFLLPSGGQGEHEVLSESQAMKNYLLQQGVPEEHIRMEDQSTSTYENMLFSKKIILEENPDAKIAFSTTNYHVFRSGMMARRVKMRAQGMGSRTKWYFWPNAAVREFVGLLTKHRLKQALVLGGIIAIYILLAVVLYYMILP